MGATLARLFFLLIVPLSARLHGAFPADLSGNDVGSSERPGSFQNETNTLRISGTGRDISGPSDQFFFAHQESSGDFDLKVRVESLDLTDIQSRAGLMMRESLEPGSAHASVLTTPTLNGVSFVYRGTSNSASIASGTFPANFPHTWLRLKKTGLNLDGFASLDGRRWTLLGRGVVSFTNNFLLGFAVSSRTTNTARAVFSDFQPVSTADAPEEFPFHEREPLGAATRRSPLVISEIMYHPETRSDQQNLEFVEIFNSNPFFENIGGFRISGSIDYTFPRGTIIPGGGFILVAAVPAHLASVHGLAGVLGPYTNNLPNSQGTLRLHNLQGALLFEVEYGSAQEWSAAADGPGHSLVLARPSHGDNNAKSWASSAYKGGSPGRIDPVLLDPLSQVKINEILANGDNTADYIELFNNSSEEADLSLSILTDNFENPKFIIPAGTKLGPGKFISFTENQLGFSLNSVEETVYFFDPKRSRVIDSLHYEGQERGISTGRYPNGSDQWHRLASRTPGASNTQILIPELVINELMYDPISRDSNDQYLELFNRTSSPVPLATWKISSGINFRFPSNAVVAANGFVVVSKNRSRFLRHHPDVNPGVVFGDFSGNLASGGEKLVLAREVGFVSVNAQNRNETNLVDVVVSEFRYGTGGRWGQWSAGGGSSLELTNPDGDPRIAANWADSDESKKAPWSVVEYSGVAEGFTQSSTDLQILLMGPGEVLLDNVEVIGVNGTNLVTNSTFNESTSGWVFQGTHEQSSLEIGEGFESSQSLHLRSSDRGDTGANKIRTTIRPGISLGNPVTIRARARWLKGNPNIVMRMHRNLFETAGTFTLPKNLGTPGKQNSRFISSPGPAIYDVTHWPVVPASEELVRVMARVQNPRGTNTLVLKYRVDPATTHTNLVMTDGGTDGDLVPGDGIYTAQLPPLSGLVAFHVEGSNLGGVTSTFPADPLTAECLIRYGDPRLDGALGIYRIWMTSANIQRWSSRLKMSNRLLDSTFIYNNRRPVYNSGIAFAGSPYHQPANATSSVIDFDLVLPEDNDVLGETDFHVSWPGNGGDDSSAQREQTGYWLASQLGLPFNYRRYVVFYLNGTRRNLVLEDSQRANSDFVEEWYPEDDEGDLFKLAIHFEWNPSVTSFDSIDSASLNTRDASTPQDRTKNFRWTWQKRATDQPHNYTNVWDLVDNLARAATYEDYARQVDVENWVRTFAVEQIVGNWDSFGKGNGQNMYSYKPERGTWKLFIWDLDIALGGIGEGSGSDLFSFSEFQVSQMMQVPGIRRLYVQALQEAAQGPLVTSNYNTFLDAKYNALLANNARVGSPNSIKTYLNARRNQINALLPQYNAVFSITSNNGNNFSTNQNLVTLTGTAPLAVRTMLINGGEWPVEWITPTTWSLRMTLATGPNRITVQGRDRSGNLVGGSDAITISYSGTVPSALSSLAITEIMYDPAVDGTEFVELHNFNSSFAFDLSKYQLMGPNYKFSPGTILEPGKYLVVAKNPDQLKRVYGLSQNVVGPYPGNLNNEGEIVRLVSTNAGKPEIVSEVRYEPLHPWPAAAAGIGSSLQLVHEEQDARRVANWSAVDTNAPPAVEWEFVTLTGTASSSLLYIYLDGAGEVFLDDLSLVAGEIPGTGSNLIRNGDFESPLSGSWTLSPNLAGSERSTHIYHGGDSSLRLVSTATGTTQSSSVWQLGNLVQGQRYTLSYWFLPTHNARRLTLRLSGNGINSTINVRPQFIQASGSTPGRANTTAAILDRFPTVWLNELQPRNMTTIRDAAGHNDPWIELYNAGNQPVSLDGLFLEDNSLAEKKWAFPSNAVIAAKSFQLVWLDGQTAENSAAELHASFRPDPDSGLILLTRGSAKTEILDYIRYQNVNADRSIGRFPDGNAVSLEQFFSVTPGSTNRNTPPPVRVFINEWMSLNSTFRKDPSDGQYDDWLELYNAGENDVNLGGYKLSDTLGTPGLLVMPSNTVIKAGGFLQIWTDDDTADNNLPGETNLHAGFRLSQNGDKVYLFSPENQIIDEVTVSALSADVTQGRWPDGGSIYRLVNPTFAASNNNPPHLGLIANQSLAEGEDLQIPLALFTPTIPARPVVTAISGSLDTILTVLTNGIFTLANVQDLPAGTFPVLVRVQDSQYPEIGSNREFQITVNRVIAQPQFTVLERRGNGAYISWSSQLGRSYQFEFKNDLSDPAWMPLGLPVVATNNVMPFVVPDIGAEQQKFYRVLVAP